MINQMVLDRVGLVGVSQVLSLSWIGVGVLGWVLVLLVLLDRCLEHSRNPCINVINNRLSDLDFFLILGGDAYYDFLTNSSLQRANQFKLDTIL